VLQMDQVLTPESEAIARLSSCDIKTDASCLDHLTLYFEKLREFDDTVARASPEKLYEAQWSILGIIKRCYELMLCALDQLSGRNWNGFYAAARGLVETLGSIAWDLDNPSRLPSLVQFDQVGIGKIMNAGYGRHPELKELYSSLSGIVHPGRDSHLLGFRQPFDPNKVVMSPFDMGFSDHFAQEKISIITNIGKMICGSLRELISRDHHDIIKQGRVMMRRQEEAQPTDALDSE